MRSFINVKSLTIVLGLSLCSVAGYLIYTLFKNQEDDDYSSSTVIKSSNYKITEIKVPADCVGTLIGRNGARIKQFQDQTNTRINFKEIDGKSKERICVIRGSQEGCCQAEHLIYEFISKQPLLESLNLWVPQKAVGKIIGRCGENIMEIINITGAQINVCDGERDLPTRELTIKGTKEQIKLAKSYIDDILEKYQMTAMKIDAKLAKREPRLPLKSSDNSVDNGSDIPSVERISPTPGQSDSSPFEVYVSAIIDPSRFWVQKVGPKATELDLLVEEMTDFYRKQDNKDAHILDNVQIGDIVAATFPYDNKWYRAEVLKLNESLDAELYYLDYGDTDTLNCKDLYELRTDFLRLHFQAIECFLARIEPVGDCWSDEAVDKFEEWTHVAQWQKLSAKLNGYCERERTRAKREGSPVPGVDLFDVANNSDIDIAEELVRHGFATFKKESSIPSRATSVSNVSVDSTK